MKKLFSSLPAKLLIGIIVGIVIGLVAPESVMRVLVPIKNIMGQVINFIVPLIVIGFIAPSITKLGGNATKLLGVALIIAYVSSVLAALLSMSAGYVLIPILNTAGEAPALREVPADIFGLAIPQIIFLPQQIAAGGHTITADIHTRTGNQPCRLIFPLTAKAAANRRLFIVSCHAPGTSLLK